MMKDVLQSWLAEDIGDGDVTSDATISNIKCQAKVSGGPGFLSGIEVCKVLLEMEDIHFITKFKDGDQINSKELIFELSGNSHDILRVERVLLNILSHLSGIATSTAKVVEKAKAINPNVQILATRKTTPGLRLFEKEAVVHGGGETHRYRLDDAILIKDNHLKINSNISELVVKARKKYPDLMVEVEADTVEQAVEANNAKADRIMLDNFKPQLVGSTVKRLREQSNVEIEVSGGINLDNVGDYAPYADFISLSSLTMSAPPVDFSLHVT
ncbi:MAG: nicotinate-nucleotide diphosphorylase (carboxylating) [Euryarchaeota archaeon]|nr:nicotinate-nucleotide diphosphorylase (carboxylating) [Euryarchaeota archaeon]